jgi:deferrochelatase/peroxidase EfeB
MPETDHDLTADPDIQGIFFRGYVKLDHAAYGFFRITDVPAFQRWLGGLLDEGAITSAAERQPEGGVVDRMNIAFTSSGLRSILADGWLPESYDSSFVAGMVAPQRSRILGDHGENAPEHWRWGGDGALDGVLMSFATTDEIACARLKDALCAPNGAEVAHLLRGRLEVDQREPFGFRDGMSQPVIEGTPRARRLRRERPREAELMIVPAGELLMGYEDGSGHLAQTPATSAGLDPEGLLRPHPIWPERRDLGRNGTYMVFRQLAQDAKGFWAYLKTEASGAPGDTAEVLAEKMVGRKLDGGPLQPRPLADPRDDNAFDFADDVEGLHCPVGSHVRRANNRAVNTGDPKGSLEVTRRHRILRRARVFHDEDGDQGLQFQCFNASIVRQFEFVQSAWCNNPFFQGLQREVDPLIGTQRPVAGAMPAIDRFTIPRRPYRRVLPKVPQFVWVRGGAYLLLPSLTALRVLAVARPAGG